MSLKSDCAICVNALNDPRENGRPSVTPCGHVFHNACINKWLAERANAKDRLCPKCNSNIDVHLLYPLYVDEADDREEIGHQKIDGEVKNQLKQRIENMEIQIAEMKDILDDSEDKYKPEATFSYIVESAHKFARGTESRFSNPVYVRGLPWKILAMPREMTNAKLCKRLANSLREKALGFFLQCNGDSDSSTWNCTAQAELRLISQKEGVQNHSRKISHTFCSKEKDWGYAQYMDFDTLIGPDSSYVKDDTFKLEVYVNADAPHGV